MHILYMRIIMSNEINIYIYTILLLLHDVGYFVYDLLLIQLCRSTEGENAKKFGRAYTQWTPEMDRALLDVLVEHHNNGGHA